MPRRPPRPLSPETSRTALLGPALLLVAIAASACSGSQRSADTAEEPNGKRFDDMKSGERLSFMKEVVMPNMAELFRGFDAERYAEMDCTTCHGAGAKQGNFHMPSSSLPALDPTDGFAAHRTESAGATTFMMDHVVPEMAALLGESAYDPHTQQGFGCFDCHEKK